MKLNYLDIKSSALTDMQKVIHAKAFRKNWFLLYVGAIFTKFTQLLKIGK